MPKKILIIGPTWLGDMVMTQVLFKLLKQVYPDCIIDVLTPKTTYSLLQFMPEVRQGFVFDLKHGQFGLKQRYRLGKSLRHAAYDQAMVLPNSFKSALIPWFAHVPQRTGWLGEHRYGLLNDWRRLDKLQYPLMIQRFAALALEPNQVLPKILPYPAFQLDDSQRQACLNAFNVSLEKPILALCPGAAFGPAKRWPADYFAQVAQQKLKDGWQVWLFGAPNDNAIGQTIQQYTHYQCTNLISKTDLTQALYLLSYAQAVVSNDSGLMHVAAALKKPLIAIYGSSSTAFTPPLSEHANIMQLELPCRPCFKRECPLEHLHCLHWQTPDNIIEAINEIP